MCKVVGRRIWCGQNIARSIKIKINSNERSIPLNPSSQKLGIWSFENWKNNVQYRLLWKYVNIQYEV